MNLDDYRNTTDEQARIADLLRLLTDRCDSVLDVGARDGYVTKLLAEHFQRVVALDLTRPLIDHPRVTCVTGDVTRLNFPDGSMECIVCAEVLEHIPGNRLPLACSELSRVASVAIVIGVPYRQDLRLGRTVCAACGKTNPPWGHVNAFDEQRLSQLFPGWHAHELSYIGKTRERTNFLSTYLMDFAGNPYGTYQQEERCVHCEAAIGGPAPRTFLQKVATRAAWNIANAQQRMAAERPKWMHMLLTRRHAA